MMVKYDDSKGQYVLQVWCVDKWVDYITVKCQMELDSVMNTAKSLPDRYRVVHMFMGTIVLS